jgi:hypothetical protein
VLIRGDGEADGNSLERLLEKRTPKDCAFMQKYETHCTKVARDRVLFIRLPTAKGFIAMALRNATIDEGTLEECLDEINDFVQTLTRYSPLMVAMAMRAHLEILLGAMLECDLCTRKDIKEFVRDLEQEVLDENDA